MNHHNPPSPMFQTDGHSPAHPQTDLNPFAEEVTR